MVVTKTMFQIDTAIATDIISVINSLIIHLVFIELEAFFVNSFLISKSVEQEIFYLI